MRHRDGIPGPGLIGYSAHVAHRSRTRGLCIIMPVVANPSKCCTTPLQWTSRTHMGVCMHTPAVSAYKLSFHLLIFYLTIDDDICDVCAYTTVCCIADMPTTCCLTQSLLDVPRMVVADCGCWLVQFPRIAAPAPGMLAVWPLYLLKNWMHWELTGRYIAFAEYNR